MKKIWLEIITTALLLAFCLYQSYELREKNLFIDQLKIHISSQDSLIQSMQSKIQILEENQEEMNELYEETMQDYEGEVSLYGRLYELYRDGKYKEAHKLENEVFTKPR